MKWDLITCEQLLVIKVNVRFSDLLKQLWSQLPAIDDMPYYSKKTEAGIAWLKELCGRLLESPELRDPEKLLNKARLFSEMTQLRPSLSKELEFHLSSKHSFILSMISFTVSMLLHIVVVWPYHHFKHNHPTSPFWCGLFCPREPKSTRPNSCSEGAPIYSDALSTVLASATNYWAKIRTLNRIQSDQSLRAISNPILASYQKFTATALPVEKVQYPGHLSRDRSTPNEQHAFWPKIKRVSWPRGSFLKFLERET